MNNKKFNSDTYFTADSLNKSAKEILGEDVDLKFRVIKSNCKVKGIILGKKVWRNENDEKNKLE